MPLKANTVARIRTISGVTAEDLTGVRSVAQGDRGRHPVYQTVFLG
jgi:hypothetical protein